jgi:hypothetical protein
MGRGRAKAKQTKVARRLKYSTPSMDLDALRQELSGTTGSEHLPVDDAVEDDDFEYEEYDDPYADVYGDDDSDDDADDEPDADSAAGRS